MNLKIISLIITFIAIITASFFLINNKKIETKNESNINELLTIEEIEQEYSSLDKANERLDTLKKRIELQGLIARGEMYFNNREYTTALTQYLQIYNRIPNDNDTNLKIGDIYYNLNRFSRAYNYYSNIKNYPNLDKKRAVYSYVNSIESFSGTLSEINREIDSLGFVGDENFYFKNSTICINDFSLCIKNFEEYFKKIDEQEKVSGEEDKKEMFSDLQNIKNAFINYENFKIDDIRYKKALITGAFFVNGFYKVSLETGKSILKENPGYKPVLKIVAKSSYELGDYIMARDKLIEYNKIESNDSDASYFLGRVYEKLNEKVLSIIHFNRAINLGYNDLSDIRRRLIFIYFELDDTDKMLGIFKDLIDSESNNLNINDYNLAVYFNILNGELSDALKYSQIAKEKYRESELFYGYESWILLQENNIDENTKRIIKINLDRALEINSENPMILMVKGIFESKLENYNEALSYFRKAIEYDRSREYSESTKFWIDETIKKMNSK